MHPRRVTPRVTAQAARRGEPGRCDGAGEADAGLGGANRSSRVDGVLAVGHRPVRRRGQSQQGFEQSGCAMHAPACWRKPTPHAGTPAAHAALPHYQRRRTAGCPVWPTHRRNVDAVTGRARCAATASWQEVTGKPAQPSTGKAAAQKG